MSDLPPGWEWATLGELGDWYGGGTPSKSNLEYWSNGTVPWLSPKDMNCDAVVTTQDKISISALENSAVHLVPQNSVAVVVRSGILERKLPVSTVPFATTLNQDMRAVVPFRGVDASWIVNYLWCVEREILEKCTKRGTTVASIDVPSLMKLPMPIAPESEQRRIVSALDDHLSRLDAGAAALAVVSRRLTRLRDRAIRAGCDGSLTSPMARVSARLPDVGLHDGELPPIPSTWRWGRLHEVADVVGGITKDTKKQSDASLDEVPYLRVANVQRGRIDLTSIATIRAPKNKVEQLLLRPVDVLLNEGGDRDKLARGWVWEGQIPVCIHQNHVFRARIRDGILDPRILAWHANSFGQAWAEANGKQSVNLASISLSKIRLMPVPIPPGDEQREIVRAIEGQIDRADRLSWSISTAGRRANRLRRSVLTEAFAGRLVPQDSSDEPASVLLERIRAMRTARPNVRRGRVRNAIQETLLDELNRTLPA
jgi:type I restriction enzyme S subunit